MTSRGLPALFFLALMLLPASAQQPQQLPRPGQGGAPPAPAPQMQPPQGRQPQAQPAPQMQPPQGRQPQAQPAPNMQPQPAQPPAGAQAPPPVAPPGPYTPVKVTLPTPHPDPGLANLRKQMAAVSQRKDRAALGRLMAAQGFFWFKGQGDGIDKRKSSLDNFATAIDLNAKDGSGWETLAAFAADETAETFPDRPNVVCSPAGPQFDEQALEALVKNTGTDGGEWIYTILDGAEVRAQPQPNAAVVDKLGLQFVRVLFDETQQPQNEQEAAFVRVVTPSGKVGYVSEEALAPLDLDQVCYVKEASGNWKIVGLISAGEE